MKGHSLLYEEAQPFLYVQTFFKENYIETKAGRTGGSKSFDIVQSTANGFLKSQGGLVTTFRFQHTWLSACVTEQACGSKYFDIVQSTPNGFLKSQSTTSDWIFWHLCDTDTRQGRQEAANPLG